MLAIATEEIPRDRAKKAWTGWLPAAVLIVAPILVKLVLYADYPGSDDAFIHLAVAEHILDGQGWGIISSSRVNMSSSPLFTVLLLPMLTVGGIGLIQAFSLACASGALAILYVTARRLTGSTAVSLLALAAAAANLHLWRWSGTVMEASLAFLAVAVIVLLATPPRDRPRIARSRLLLLGLAIGIGTLVRFEIGLFLPLALVSLWLNAPKSRRAGAALIVGGFAPPLLVWVAFSTFYFGSPVPTTFTAKASSYHLVNLSLLRDIGSVVVSGFSFSLLLGLALVVAMLRLDDERHKLVSLLRQHIVLVGWPLGLFLFYYVKTDYLQSAARYYLPGMYAIPLLIAILLSASSFAQRRIAPPALAAIGVATLILGLVLSLVQVVPVLRQFKDGYRAAMTAGATFLRENCSPGDTALIYVDIGIMADDGIGACRLADGGGLATPELQEGDLDESVAKVDPAFVVQSIGAAEGELLAEYPDWQLVYSRSYTAHGVSTAGNLNFLNVYRTGG
jgi:hypothetical protein